MCVACVLHVCCMCVACVLHVLHVLCIRTCIRTSEKSVSYEVTRLVYDIFVTVLKRCRRKIGAGPMNCVLLMAEMLHHFVHNSVCGFTRQIHIVKSPTPHAPPNQCCR
jgi:hypothetical protein